MQQIDQQLNVGRFGHEGILYAADKGLCGRNIRHSVVVQSAVSLLTKYLNTLL